MSGGLRNRRARGRKETLRAHMADPFCDNAGMADRMLEIIAPGDKRAAIEQALTDPEVLEVWYDESLDSRLEVRALLSAEATESVVDNLESGLSAGGPYRIIVLPVEAVIPRPKGEPDPEGASTPATSKAKSRISREELHADLSPSARWSWKFLTMVVLSTVVAAIGLHRDNTTVVIGGMLIAPLLGPNMALALATTLGDVDLGKQALTVNVTGLLAAFFLSLVLGLVLDVDPSLPELESRTHLGIADVLLATAAGISGVLAFTSGVPASIIGVMVAVALLPPLVALGMVLGAGYWTEALGAFLLLVTNVICVNLAGVVTFLVQGVRPRTWWEADKAKRAARVALWLWVTLLVILVVAIAFSQKAPEP